ncbi:MAG: M23 family metallopeptidase [Rhizobiales bacterium]|nr:M23 family metallopeptidase [Hyphomicrobiales bacterium]
MVSVLALFAMLLAWGAGMTLVLIFGDRLSARLIAQNSEMQDAYEQRLQAYRDEIARVVTEAEQTRVDKDSVVGRVVELTRRQRALETRQTILNRLAEQIGSNPGPAAAVPPLSTAPGGAAPPPPPQRPGFPTRTTQPPSQTRGDLGDGTAFQRWADGPPTLPSAAPVRLASTDRGAALRFAQMTDAPTIETTVRETDPETEAQVGRLEKAVAQLDTQQTGSLNGFARLSDIRIGRVRNALATLGLPLEQLVPPAPRGATALAGLQVPISEEKTPFGQRINQIKDNVSLLYRVRPAMTAMPVARPTIGFRLASPFGFRIHPIYHTQKLHAGLDMAAPLGTQIHAAGSGIVLSAGWAGGYGNMVQIDHGNGVISRYAHMSAIEVAQGQPIAVGGLVGLMGSTGASTGSHLHFETRLRGVPQNPACFLIAGDRLRDVENPGFNCDKPPFQQKMPDHSEDEDSDSEG